MKTFYQQFYFNEQEGNVVDTVQFVVPDSVTEEEFNKAVTKAKQAFNKEYYGGDKIAMADEMVVHIAEYVCGLYEFIDINSVIKIE